MDGYETTRAIRNEELRMKNSKNPHPQSFIPHCKIITVTASSFEEEQAMVLSAGCDGFFTETVHNHRGV